MVHVAASGSAENLDLWFLEFSNGLLFVSGFRIGRVTCLILSFILCELGLRRILVMMMMMMMMMMLMLMLLLLLQDVINIFVKA